MRFDLTRPIVNAKAFTVSQLNRKASALLEKELDRVWVEAEVTDVTRARSGHVYFTLSDPDGKAQISAVMWKGVALRYGTRLRSGAGARCRGRITIYEVRGSYQLVVDRIEEGGAGLKARLLAELKAKLTAEGFFDSDRKRLLPSSPQCVGIVTSRDGAALRDIIKVVTRRYPVRLVLAHAQVQGEAAPHEIVRALGLLATEESVDVVIVGRGGGSAEDLDAFNDEEVVRAVGGHPRPVISAVGHEVDITLVDLVADRRAATPSEAAEIAVPDAAALLEALAASEEALVRALRQSVSEARAHLSVQEGRLRTCDPRMDLRRGIESLSRAREVLGQWPELALTRARSRLALAEEPLSRWPGATLERASSTLAAAREPLARWPGPALSEARAELSRLAGNLEALSPLSSLSRGYAVVRKMPGKEIVRSAADAPPGSEVDITLARGRLMCDVKRSSHDPGSDD